MAIPPFIRKSVENTLHEFCDTKVPEHVRDKIRFGFRVRGNSVILFEERPFYLDHSRWIETVIAQFRFDIENGKWTLYWADRNSRWHVYDELAPNKIFNVLLKEVEKDPTGIFLG